MPLVPQPGGPEEEEDLRRRELLLCGEPPDTIEEGTRRILGWLLHQKQKAANKRKANPLTMIGPYTKTHICISIIGESGAGKTAIARRVYQHPSVVSSFQHRAWVNFGGAERDFDQIWRDILEQIPPPDVLPALTNEKAETKRPRDKLIEYLQGKMCLIVLDDAPYARHDHWQSLLSGSASASAVICTGTNIMPDNNYKYQVWRKYYEFSVIKEEGTRPWFFRRRAFALANKFEPVENVLRRCYHDAFALQMLLHLLYVNPNLIGEETLLSSLDCNKNSIAKGMLMFCYNQLPISIKSCLLYLSVFPQGHVIRRTSLLRRWIAEGLIAQPRRNTGKVKASHGIFRTLQDQAERIFDALVVRGFLRPRETSTSGMIRSCTMHHIVHDFITTDVSIVDTCLPSHLAHRLSVNGGEIAIQEESSSSRNGASDDVTKTLLESMPQSPQWQLLKVLDLEGCTGLKNNKNLRNICKILLLRYLSLRNTDVTELPKQIEKLQCLETLDIRQTAIQASSTKSIVLPMLKYFLAGHTISPSKISDRFHETFVTVRTPGGIRRMRKLEVMSHVEVSGNVDVLVDIGQLLQLRKLGVVLNATEDVLNLLFQQIEKLHGCLRSLSIRINQQIKSGSSPDGEVVVVPNLVHPPMLLESLNICGLKTGLPHWVVVLDRLFKVTLRETSLGEDAMHILGKLRLLRCLRLLHNSYTESKLNFEVDEFQLLRFLVVEGSSILNISFADGATPKLEQIVWSFATLEALSGLNLLPKLKKLNLNGDCSLDQIEAQLKDHTNHPVVLNYIPHHQYQEDVTAVATSSLSAP